MSYAHIEVSKQEWADWFAAKQEADRAKVMYLEHNNLLKKRAADHGTDPVDVIVNGTTVATIHTDIKERFDSARFKEQYPHIWAQFLTTYSMQRTVAKKGVDADGRLESDGV